jgi:uncharacterized protein YqgV (UPF0045/DUF77 family)
LSSEPEARVATVSVEFFVEPFEEGSPGPHVRAAVAAMEAAGLAVDLGPFGSVASGPADAVAGAVGRLLEAAFAAGATRVQVHVQAGGT